MPSTIEKARRLSCPVLQPWRTSKTSFKMAIDRDPEALRLARQRLAAVRPEPATRGADERRRVRRPRGKGLLY